MHLIIGPNDPIINGVGVNWSLCPLFYRMKYFSYNLVAAANDWIEQSEEEHLKAEKRFWCVVEDYHRELEDLESRVSQKAWHFFRHGFGRYGLHDATLLSFNIGDGLDYDLDGSSQFRLDRQKTSVRLEFLNNEQDLHYLFDLRGINSVQSNLFVENGSASKSIGDLFTYELTATDSDILQLGFLFATGASIIVQSRKLVFRRRRIKRQ
jgi:hypothetical protein